MRELTGAEYKAIGIAVARIEPSFAKKCLEAISRVKPKLHDGKLVGELFTQFCAIKGISGIDSKSLSITEYVYLRHVFIAVIIKLFNPELLSPYHPMYMRRGLRNELSKALNVSCSWLSQTLNTVCVRLSVYEDFKDDVDDVLCKLKY